MANDVLSLLCDRNESKKTTYMNGLNELFGLCKTVKLETVQIVNLMEKENHPFKVIDDASMKALAESISRVGVMQPIIVRPAGGCKYEILSGHRRTRASELCGKTEIDAAIVEADDELANRIVILTNFHQRTIRYPSEIAKSYQIRYNDLKKRKNSNGWNCETDKLDRIMEREFATSKSKIYMYLRLNYLTDELLEALDNKKIKLKAAVEISYVSEEIQNIIYDYVLEREIYKLNVRKAGKIKRLSIEKEVSEEDIQKILSDDEKIKNDIYFGTSEIEKYKHKFKNNEEMKRAIINFLENY